MTRSVQIRGTTVTLLENRCCSVELQRRGKCDGETTWRGAEQHPEPRLWNVLHSVRESASRAVRIQTRMNGAGVTIALSFNHSPRGCVGFGPSPTINATEIHPIEPASVRHRPLCQNHRRNRILYGDKQFSTDELNNTTHRQCYSLDVPLTEEARRQKGQR